MSSTATSRRGSTYADLNLNDFSGGLNLRDAPTELDQNETPDCLNVVLDERGGVTKRLGYVRWNPDPLPESASFGYASAICNCNFWYTPADGKLYRDVNGVMTNVLTLTPGGRVSIVDFVTAVPATLLIHSIDGWRGTTDGTSWSTPVPSSGTLPVGDQLAVWQNKLWVADSTTNLLSFSAPGDAREWDSSKGGGANHIKEGNDFPIVCLYGTAGFDQGAGSETGAVGLRPRLLVGKRFGAQGSTHRVTDASTADYVTLDLSIGPGGPGSITNIYGQLYMIGPQGIFRTDGESTLEPIGEKLGRLFHPDSVDYTKASTMIAGRSMGGRLRFSFAQKGSEVNDRVLEYHPVFNAFTMRTDAASWYVQANAGALLGVSPVVSGRIWRYGVGGDDDGEQIDSRILTGVFEPASGYEARLQHVRVLGRGAFTVTAQDNFHYTGKSKDLTFSAEGLGWDVDGWDDPDVGWGEPATEKEANFWPRLDGREFQIRLSESSTLAQVDPPLNEDGAALETGAWGCFGLRLSFTPLAPS